MFFELCISQGYIKNFERDWKDSFRIRVNNFAISVIHGSHGIIESLNTTPYLHRWAAAGHKLWNSIAFLIFKTPLATIPPHPRASLWRIAYENWYGIPLLHFLQKQQPEVFCKKRGVLKNFIFTGKHMCWSDFIKKRLQRKCFTVKFAKFLRAPILKNDCFCSLLTHCYRIMISFQNLLQQQSMITDNKNFVGTKKQDVTENIKLIVLFNDMVLIS